MRIIIIILMLFSFSASAQKGWWGYDGAAWVKLN